MKFINPLKILALSSAFVAMTLAIACGSTTDTPAPDQPDTGLRAILATTDLGVGPNRVSFLLTTPKSLVTAPEATIQSFYRDDAPSQGVAVETVQATFHPWPYGTRGNYVADFNLDRPGRWELAITVQHQGQPLNTIITLPVAETTLTPGLGTQPPLTPNKTLDDVSGPAELTSSSAPDLDLYRHRIEDIVDNGRPALVVFASPAFCTTPTCGPQVETVQQVKDRFQDAVDFIHIEVYDNPQAIQGDLDQGEYAPAVSTWGLSKIADYLNESWVFILDRQGRITRKYEGFASADELEQGLAEVV